MSALFLPEYQDVEVVAPGARTGKGGNPHHYLIGEQRYSRVTTALNIINKPALIPWAKRIALDKVRQVLMAPDVRNELETMGYEVEFNNPDREVYEGWVDRLIQAASDRPDEVRDATAALGTEAHEMIASTLFMSTTERVEYREMVDDVMLPAYDGAIAFIDDHDIHILETELTVWDEALGVAGTVDGVGRTCDGALVIWDWKRSARLYWETALQLSAYAHCLEHQTGEAVCCAWAVRLLRKPAEAGEPLYEEKLLGDDAWEEYKHAVHLQRAGNMKWWREE